MEVGLKKDSPITYSNGKRLFTIDQKVDALVRIKMTGCSKAEVARSLHVAESTFRGWFKNKDIVMKAEAKYNEIKSKSSSPSASASSDGYKSDDNSKSFSVDGSDNNSSTFTDEREGSHSRFSSPDPCVSNPVRRSPERLHSHQPHHHKLKLKKQQLNNSLNLNNNNTVGSGLLGGGLMGGGLNAGLNAGFNASLNASLSAGFNASLSASLSAGLNASLSAGLGVAGLGAAGLSSAGLGVPGLGSGHGSAGLNGGLSLDQQHQQLKQHLTQIAHHPLHHNMSSIGGLKSSNVAAAAVAAAAAAAAAADHASLRLNPVEIQNKINSYFGPISLQAPSLPGAAASFIPQSYTAENSSYNNSSSFINTMVTATLMEPQALDLTMHSRNKCKDCKPSLSTTTTVSNTTTQPSPKIQRHNSYRSLYKPYNSRCTGDIAPTTQGINPRHPLWQL